MVLMFFLFILGAAVGGIAAIVGFGVGSFATPVLALRTDFATAVAAVGVAHFCGSALRFWLLRTHVNRRLLLGFGLLSAAGGLAGALLQGVASSLALALVFGGLMVFAGISSLLRWTDRLNVGGRLAWLLGALSGFFGGLVGNQGGLRAAALLGFNIGKTEFVATATAVALLVDVVRLPVYLATQAHQLAAVVPEIIALSLGVVIGTLVGAPIMRRLPERQFRTTLAVVLIVVGVLIIGVPGNK